jgi:DNA-binding response OmpR family regulator
MNHPIRILIVDDSADDRFFLRRALGKTHFPVQIFEAKAGDEAIAFLQSPAPPRPNPDVMFLDLKMPGKTGFDVLRWMQEHPTDPKMLIVVLSGSELETDKRLAHELGAQHYIVKSPSLEQLRAGVASTLDRAARAQ